jgi:hypothetical protein
MSAIALRYAIIGFSVLLIAMSLVSLYLAGWRFYLRYIAAWLWFIHNIAFTSVILLRAEGVIEWPWNEAFQLNNWSSGLRLHALITAAMYLMFIVARQLKNKKLGSLSNGK